MGREVGKFLYLSPALGFAQQELPTKVAVICGVLFLNIVGKMTIFPILADLAEKYICPLYMDMQILSALLGDVTLPP